MLYVDQNIPELYQLAHRHDTPYVAPIEYQDRILFDTLSVYISENDNVYGFLQLLSGLVSLFFDSKNILRNFHNPIVDKYDYRHVQ
jgi:hypothetical protein